MMNTVLRARTERGSILSSLRRKRIVAGLSMNQVARMTGISKTAISLYENKRRELSVKKAKILAKAYGCGWEELFDDDDQVAVG